MARLGIAGFQHETNTFAPLTADLEAFETCPVYPRLPRGNALLEAMEGLNLPIAGFIGAARADSHRCARASGAWQRRPRTSATTLSRPLPA